MIRQIIKYSIPLFLFQTLIYSQNIKIRLTPESEFISNEILNLIEKRDVHDKETLADEISRFLNSEGYFHSIISIKTDADSCAPVSINIDLGNPTYLGNVSINGAGGDSSDVANLIVQPEGSIFLPEVIEKNAEDVNLFFEKKGFPFAEVEISSVLFRFDSTVNREYADVYFDVRKNFAATIDSVALSGNSKTSRDVIIRNLPVKIGDKFLPEKIKSIPTQLNKLRIFKSVEMPKFFLNSENKGILSITVEEQNTNNIDGIIGYVPPQANGKDGYFMGLLNLSFRNLFGTRRGFGFKWEKEDRNSQNLNLRYFEPWLFSLPLNLSFDFMQRQQDSTYVKRKVYFILNFIATENISAGISFSSESVIPTINKTGTLKVGSSSVSEIGLNLTIDTRDDFYAPTSGIKFMNSYYYSSKSISNPADIGLSADENSSSLQKIELDFSFYYKIADGHIAALSLFLRQISGDLLEISDVYRVGGANTIRGYRENQFIGNRILWSNFEYRLLLTRRTFLSLFFDSGYYVLEDKVLKIKSSTSGFIYGYGLGINLETGLGMLKVGYAIGKGESLNEGKIHFGLLNEF